MGDPFREQLPHSDDAERGMVALGRELTFGELQSPQRRDVLGPQRRELIQQLRERLPLTLANLGESIVRLEPPTRPMSEDELDAGDPVGGEPREQGAERRAPSMRGHRSGSTSLPLLDTARDDPKAGMRPRCRCLCQAAQPLRIAPSELL